ncbi:hypothetical protein ACH4TX_38455 [Streptomyces sp. NPDC021098]|uniref:hypothetical protein n=1 Tax=unclassified Streptomyces TaxID=2593676 RepID=UPI003796A71B
MGLSLIREDVTEEPYRVHAWVWSAGEDVQLGYAEDSLVGERYLRVISHSPVACAEFGTLVVGYFRPWGVEELLAKVAEARVSDVLSESVVRLGVGAPVEFDQRFFCEISRAMRSSEQKVQMSAILASSYALWPEFLRLLSEIERNAKEGQVKDYAASIRELISGKQPM